MLVHVHGKERLAKISKDPEFAKDLPKFQDKYDEWYSESIAVIKQILPDRLSDFIAFYEKPRGRKNIDSANYVIQDYLQGIQLVRSHSKEVIAGPSDAVSLMSQQIAILSAAKKRFTSSLFEIRQIVQADLFDSEISSARELLKHKFLRAACAIAGVVLEKHLRQVLEDRNIKIAKENPGISDLNEILKSTSIIDIPQWRHITLLGDYRNLCDHSKQSDPSSEQVKDLIDGTDKVLRTVS